MSLPAFMGDPYHVVIGGETGSGKTHFTDWIHSRTDRISIFFNSAHVEYVHGVQVQTVRELADALQRGIRKFNFQPRIGADEEELHMALTKFLFSLGKRGHEFLLITDEVHLYAPHGGKNSGTLQYRMGRNYNVKNIGISQEFRSVNHTVLTQAKHHVWIGQPNTMESKYFKKYSLPFEALRENDPHEYAIMHGGEVTERGEAPAQY